MIKIKIALWGQLKAAVQTDAVELEVGQPYTLENALQTLVDAAPALKGMLTGEDGRLRQSILAFVNGVQLAWHQDHALRDGTEMTLMSPIAGG